jgi:DNA-binding transcriptional LysR family regulator
MLEYTKVLKAIGIVARSSQVDFIIGLVAANVGVAILPEMIDERV